MLLLTEQSLTDGHEKKIVMHYTLYIIEKAMFYISKRYIGRDNLEKNLNISERKIKDGHSI